MANNIDGTPFEKLNPILQAEYIEWTDSQYDRLKDSLPPGASRKEWMETCMDRDSAENLYRGIVISAYTVGYPNTVDVATRNGIGNDILDNALGKVCTDFRLNEVTSILDKMAKDGKHPLRFMVQPHSGNIIANFPPVSLHDYAHYRKAGNRVYQFLNSLGEPDEALRREFLEDILCVERLSDKTFSAKSYEQHLMLDVSEGGLNRTVFIDFYVGPVNGIVMVRERGMGQRTGAYIISTRREINGVKYTQEEDAIGNLDGEKYKWAFDLLVNTWVAEKTGMAILGGEPKPEQARVRNIVKNATGRTTIPGVVYDYIRVTDKAWELHKESQRALSEHNSDSTWTKALWWRRQHFSVRGDRKVFIKGHWCHRKCGPVIDEPEVVEILV